MHPEFIDGTAGKLFILYHPPASDASDRGDLVFVPPFAEELNRSRHMVNRTARALSAAGWGVLILDLVGTGDSAGDFGDARWDIWQQDILTACAWLRDQGRRRIGIWAMRTGALLVSELMATGHHWHPLLFWQPVLQGKTFMTQFLRIALAAEMTGTEAAETSGTVTALRDRLAAGDTLEVAGYTLHPDLAAALERAQLAPPRGWAGAVYWMEISATAPDLSPGTRRAVESWQGQGATVTARAVTGPQFWMLQEPEPAEELAAATTAALREDTA